MRKFNSALPLFETCGMVSCDSFCNAACKRPSVRPDFWALTIPIQALMSGQALQNAFSQGGQSIDVMTKPLHCNP